MSSKLRSTTTRTGLDARVQLYNEGYRPVPPLADSVDLWADDELVCAYSRAGKIRVLMIRHEYDLKRGVIEAGVQQELLLIAPDTKGKV